MQVCEHPQSLRVKWELRPSDCGHGTLGMCSRGTCKLQRAEVSHYAGVDRLALALKCRDWGTEPANDLKGVEHALGVRVSLVLSACSLSHILCLSHLVGTADFKWERYLPVTEHTREEVETPSRR